MDPKQLRSQLRGVIAFPVTPFKADLSLDLEGLRKNLSALAAHPLCAIIAAGGTGELYSLTPAEHLQVVRATVEQVGGKIPVLAAAGFNPAIAAELARAAAAAGANGILAFPPYYPQPDDEGIVEYYKAIAGATQLPMIIYSRDWFNPGAGLVEKLAGAIPNLIAWKDGQGDVRRYQLIRQRLGDRLHWIGGAGDDLVPGYYSMGIRTYTSSIANIAPKLSLALHERGSAGDSGALAQMMSSCVLPLYAFRGRRRGYEVSAMKSIMEMMHLAGGPVRPPLLNVKSEEMPELQRILEAYKAYI
ncbi:MAG TPA: dihydrodipicolinate synthase family protein [Tepidisphaeraceae bacterium]|nr:dihydrodipicolinate synthase family protein [Tepidisphaeraceae bacterium]